MGGGPGLNPYVATDRVVAAASFTYIRSAHLSMVRRHELAQQAHEYIAERNPTHAVEHRQPAERHRIQAEQARQNVRHGPLI